MRETLFNVLGPSVAGARVLDAFAGTGAIGLEALSRGAASVTFVEHDPRALAAIAKNVALCGAENACNIIRGDAFRVPSGEFDLIVADPPYSVEHFAPLVDVLASAVAPGGRLVLEHSRRRPSPERASALTRTRVLHAGDSALSFYQL